mgnify:FL=1
MAKTKNAADFKSPNVGKIMLTIMTIFIFAVIGIYFLSGSKAATPPYFQILNYQNAEQNGAVTNPQVQIDSIGAQTVSKVDPGVQLSYLVGGKVAVKNQCYYFQLQTVPGGGTTATIEFTGQGSSSTVNVTYDPSSAAKLRRVCVPSGTQALKSYNVFNKSAANGPSVLMYQDVVTL